MRNQIMTNQNGLVTWLLRASLAAAFVAGAVAPARAFDLGSLTKKAAGGAHDAARRAVILWPDEP